MKGMGGVMNKSQDLSVSSNPPPAPPQPQLTALTMACSILLSMALTPLLLELRGGAGGGQNGAVMGCASPLPHSPGVCVGPTIAQRGVGGVATSPSFPTSPPPAFPSRWGVGDGETSAKGKHLEPSHAPKHVGEPQRPGSRKFRPPLKHLEPEAPPPNTWECPAPKKP